MGIRSVFSRDMSPKQWKNPAMLKSFRKFPAADSDADDFQNLISFSWSKDTSLAKFSWRTDFTWIY